MKIKGQSYFLGILGILTAAAVGFLFLQQLQNNTDLSRKMQNHQEALVQLNGYQVSAITQILLSVDLVRTGDIGGERIVQYRMSETRLTREVANLENLLILTPSLSDEIEELRKSGENLSRLCKTELMEPLYSHKPLKEGIIDRLIYTELTGLNTQVNGIENSLNSILKNDLAAQRKQERRFNRIYLPLAGLLFIILLLGSHFIISRSLKYINKTERFLGDLAAGKSSLDVSMPERGNDEITRLRKNFNRFMNNLSERHSSLKNMASDHVNLGQTLNSLALEHAAASLQLDGSLHNVNARGEEVTSQVDSSLGEIRRISRALESLEDLSASLEKQVADMAGQGEKIQSALMTQQSAVNEQVNLTSQVKEESLNSKRILELLRGQIEEILLQSTSISDSIRSIGDLADQTDILAINASIEAAHSGRYGAGFTVVASEMRSLSGQVRRNASGISSLLSELNERLSLMSREEKENQQSLERLIGQNGVAEGAVRDLEKSNKNIGRAVENFFSLVESARGGSSDVHSQTELVRNSSKEIASHMERINESQRDVQSETEEMIQAVTRLSRGSGKMKKLSEENIAMADHLEDELDKLGS